MSLAELPLGGRAIINFISTDLGNTCRRRLLDLGFINGTEIELLNIGFMGETFIFKIRNTKISLRKEQAESIMVKVI